MNRYAVIMAGGRGERFWPESRVSKPKQFLQLMGDRTLLQQAYDRLLPLIPSENIYIVLGQQHLDLAIRQLPDIPPGNFLVEPEGRNTAPCIGFAAIHILKRDSDSLMLAIPADHMIRGEASYRQSLEKAFFWAAKGDYLVTVGIRPSRPETGYGYIEREDSGMDTHPPVYFVRRFVEKPDAEQALKFIQEGCFFWNSGIFAWKPQTILRRIELYLPRLAAGLEKIGSCIGNQDYMAMLKEVYPKLPSISIDYGVMEHSREILMVAGEFGWDDLGSWGALDRIVPGDERGMKVRGNFVGYDNDNCLVYGDGGLTAVLGVRDLVIVRSGDVVMVCPKDRAQEVRKLVELCKNNKLGKYL